jgi:Ca-activated chloride channel family protein
VACSSSYRSWPWGARADRFVAPVEAPTEDLGPLAKQEAIRVGGALASTAFGHGGASGGVPGGVVGGLVDEDFHTEAYDRIQDNPFLAAATNPLSTFSIDVDTASYANVRRFLRAGSLPPKDAVRIEELVNYFRYDYEEPRGEGPLSVTTEVSACPWRPEHRLLLVGLRGRSLDEKAVPPRRLTFLVDVSGSMQPPDKLPLLKRAMTMLAENLRERDRVAIVVYAGSSGLVLPPTSGERQAEIREALASLEAGGSTAGGAGIELAYRVAAEMYEPGAIKRVLLATDGDFNVGLTSIGELSRLIEEKRKGGVFLSVLGFGQGNLKDATMEMLGYENRLLRAEDFDDDRKDAGEIGAGHTVTALYEVVPAGLPLPGPAAPALKYQQAPALSPAAASDELLTVKLRYKQPEGVASRLLATTVAATRGDGRGSDRVRFAAAVAAFGMLLRESEHRGGADWPMVLGLAEGAKGPDTAGYRAEFLELARAAAELAAPRRAQVTR